MLLEKREYPNSQLVGLQPESPHSLHDARADCETFFLTRIDPDSEVVFVRSVIVQEGAQEDAYGNALRPIRARRNDDSEGLGQRTIRPCISDSLPSRDVPENRSKLERQHAGIPNPNALNNRFAKQTIPFDFACAESLLGMSTLWVRIQMRGETRIPRERSLSSFMRYRARNHRNPEWDRRAEGQEWFRCGKFGRDEVKSPSTSERGQDEHQLRTGGRSAGASSTVPLPMTRSRREGRSTFDPGSDSGTTDWRLHSGSRSNATGVHRRRQRRDDRSQSQLPH